jgi:hypothetical protein
MADTDGSVPTRFLVELRAPALGFHDVAELARRARSAADEAGAGGSAARFVRAVSVPEDGACLLVFEAHDQAVVEDAARLAFGEVARVSPVIVVSGELGLPGEAVGPRGGPEPGAAAPS